MHSSRIWRTRGALSAVAAIAALAPVAASAEAPPTPVPNEGGPAGTVTGTVTTPPPVSPCILITNTAIEFGTRPFQRPGLNETFIGLPVTGVSSCSTGPNDLFARVSAATNPGQNLRWTPIAPPGECPGRGPNRFGYQVFADTAPLLTGIDRMIGSVAPDQTEAVNHRIFMPCAGSVGAGETFTTTVTFTATTQR